MVDLVRTLRQGDTDSPDFALVTTPFHNFLAHLAIRLLQVNYELSDSGWAALMRFERMDDMLALTSRAWLAVSHAGELAGPLVEATRRSRVGDSPLN